MTGIAYASTEALPVLVAIAFVGTVNPTSGDVSSFLPVEQAILAQTGEPLRRVNVFAWFSVIGSIAAALGALASALGPLIDAMTALGEAGATRLMFLAYAFLGALTAAVVGRLGAEAELPAGEDRGGLGPSRRRVGGLSALFALDSFAGGLVVQSVIALFFLREFDMEPAVIGAVFFGTSLFAAVSFLVSARLANRFGLVNTMVFTHLPSNAFLLGVALSPVAWLAVAFLFARSLLSQMDVPPRQALVVSVVEPGERAAAAAATGLARSIGATPAPTLGGAMLGVYAGLPFIACAAMKSTYDLLLLGFFGRVERRS
jgi:MFS family permease